MRFQLFAVFLPFLCTLTNAIPIALPLARPLPTPDTTQPNNALINAANVLVNGIQDNLNHGQQEIQTVTTLQSLESNSASAADIQTGITNVKAALNLAIADRTNNQALATPDFPNVLTGLAKVQAAQTSATATVAKLSGDATNDAPILTSLLTTFKNGFATNQNNLMLAEAYI